MATKTTVHLVDDITGEPADDTVSFGLDGTEYEIDLASHRAYALRDALADFVAKARKTGKLGAPAKASRGRSDSTPARVSREQTAAVRDWARAHGFAVGDRGRIPTDAQTAFDEAHASKAQPSAVVAEPADPVVGQPVFSG